MDDRGIQFDFQLFDLSSLQAARGTVFLSGSQESSSATRRAVFPLRHKEELPSSQTATRAVFSSGSQESCFTLRQPAELSPLQASRRAAFLSESYQSCLPFRQPGKLSSTQTASRAVSPSGRAVIPSGNQRAVFLSGSKKS
jgi:hypothetical protein